MNTSTIAPRLEELWALLAKATASYPDGAEAGSDMHRYWLNGITGARIEIADRLPALLDHIERLEAALRPFARVGDIAILAQRRDETGENWISTGSYAALNISDFRHARDVLPPYSARLALEQQQ